MWIRGLGGERLLTMSYALPPNMNMFFCIYEEGSRLRICRLFSTHQPTIYLRSRYRINPRSTRFVSGNTSGWPPRKKHADSWCRGREVARGFLRTLLNRAKISILCHQRGIEIFAVCFLYTSGQTFFFSQTPDRRPPHITGRHGNIVSLGWVGPLNKRAPFRVYDAVLGFIDQCLTRTRMADQGAGVS